MVVNIKWILVCLSLYYLLAQNVAAYKPVFLIHGIFSDYTGMLNIAQRIIEKHPGTKVYNTNKYTKWESIHPMWQQVSDIGSDLKTVSAHYPEGIHLIGYSQGGLIARGILESFPDHNVQTFISLSSPQAGQYGTEFLRIYFPGLICRTAYELFYSEIGQHISVANYWNDPHHQDLYRIYSNFLPYINNEIMSPNSNVYKKGFTKLKKLVMIGGPDDGVITPWQSSHFGYYDEKENVVEMKDRTLYTKDTFGLRTLDEKKKLVIIAHSGINHTSWHTDNFVIDNFIIPYLD